MIPIEQKDVAWSYNIPEITLDYFKALGPNNQKCKWFAIGY